MKIKITLKALIISALFINQLISRDYLKPIPTTTPPVIDGVLNDEVWKNAVMVTGFRTFVPDFGKTMPESTVVYTTYDKENLYFAWRCFDPDPKTIKAEITNRDNIRPHDWVCINLDSYNDQQSLYGFYVNPLGIQEDSRYAAQKEDFGVDFIWQSAGRIHDEGYDIEIKIPFKSIRFKNTNPVTMSVIFERKISRRSEQGTFPPLDPKMGYQFALQGMSFELNDIEHYTLLEVIPASTVNQKFKLNDNVLKKDYSKTEFSLTAKYGITSDLILDATLNPDFSHVEADAGQVDLNLRSSLFFSEKRPFFLEGSEIFNVAASSHANIVVHTRTIVNPEVGLKLSGKISENGTLASIFATDELTNSSGSSTGVKAQIPILRYKHTLSEDSYVGGIFTGRETENNYNRVAGIDGFLRIDQSSYFNFQMLGSSTKTTDTAANILGHTYAFSYNYSVRELAYHFDVSKIDKNYFAQDGYVARNGILTLIGAATPKFYPNSEFIRRIDLDFFSSQTKDLFYNKWETYNSINTRFTLTGALNFNVRYNYSTEIFFGEKFNTSGLQFTGGGQIRKDFNFSLNFRTGESIYYSGSPFQGYSSRFAANFVYQPWSQFEFNLNSTFVNFYKEANDSLIYKYPIFRGKLTYQFNKYLFLRAIGEYNQYKKTMLTDFLSSFTYIPFTIFYVGYGSLYSLNDNDSFFERNKYLETNRGLFVKASYLWRL